MSQPPPPNDPNYAGVDPNAADVSYLKTISILHYVWGGIILFFSLLMLIYIGFGVAIVSGTFAPAPMQGPTTGPAVNADMPREFGWFFIGFGGIAMMVGLTLGILNIVSGRRIEARRSRVFSFVIAGINCVSFPFGTALGVFTFILLSKDSVKAMYQRA
jgi:hypothetical protein